ncbi:phage tail family protein [Sinomonas sp. JGH33]|uniref:Phage tail family protein n=1 Tax=Sinomonas terricola TaxID=3110330 RepID=A0ABU5T4M9_9MICC|nr:hypothetical protein [Sinomonas sp. JGH33]MEA5454469.1 phage tail family protein [Sinomonas sp. JGH33]
MPRTATVGGISFAATGWTHPDGWTVWLDNNAEGWDDGVGVRRERPKRLRQHGEFTEPGYRDGRLVTLEGDVTAPSEAAAAGAKLALAALLADGGQDTLTVVDTALPTMSALADLADAPKIRHKNDTTLEYQIHLHCPDPRKYGATVSATTGVPVPGGGITYPLFSPSPPGLLDFGQPGYPGTATVANTGKAATPPRFTITATTMPSGFTITDVGARRRLVYTGAIGAGDSLKLDARSGSVLLNGYADRGSLLTVREWTRLAAGASGTWLFEAAGSTGAQLLVEADPAWW